MLIECTGDLFSSDCPTLGHGVNTVGVMEGGIAVEFRRRWPDLYEAYAVACNTGQLKPGQVFVYEAADRLILNMATQDGVGRGAARIEWVRACAEYVAGLGLSRLAIPRIGCGLGGLQWEDVRPVLEETLAPIPRVEVWSLPTTAR